ncbi:hypothetical protein GQ43DRAFT_428041 [Delitschia confertaspora ATCC 74209]|uniref:Uncharacterized protein n=1 Tax=Delitschia confertaspora ATCC 74209 TaxID=1513339 RepID=A0A9P4JTF5_9PLEO|nr:hypothetical protein GQ43DRAFT_428041 [Delitschia confertaspora ATCC 74209]
MEIDICGYDYSVANHAQHQIPVQDGQDWGFPVEVQRTGQEAQVSMSPLVSAPEPLATYSSNSSHHLLDRLQTGLLSPPNSQPTFPEAELALCSTVNTGRSNHSRKYYFALPADDRPASDILNPVITRISYEKQERQHLEEYMMSQQFLAQPAMSYVRQPKLQLMTDANGRADAGPAPPVASSQRNYGHPPSRHLSLKPVLSTHPPSHQCDANLQYEFTHNYQHENSALLASQERTDSVLSRAGPPAVGVGDYYSPADLMSHEWRREADRLREEAPVNLWYGGGDTSKTGMFPAAEHTHLVSKERQQTAGPLHQGSSAGLRYEYEGNSAGVLIPAIQLSQTSGGRYEESEFIQQRKGSIRHPFKTNFNTNATPSPDGLRPKTASSTYNNWIAEDPSDQNASPAGKKAAKNTENRNTGAHEFSVQQSNKLEGYRFQFLDNPEAALAFRDRVTAPPKIVPEEDSTIGEVERNRNYWFHELFKAIVNLDDITPAKRVTIDMFTSLTDRCSVSDIEATCWKIFFEVLDRCRNGFRGRVEGQIDPRGGRFAPMAQQDAETNCLQRISNVISVLRWNKNVCVDAMKYDFKIRKLVDAPLRLLEEKKSYGKSNATRAKANKQLRASFNGKTNKVTPTENASDIGTTKKKGAPAKEPPATRRSATGIIDNPAPKLPPPQGSRQSLRLRQQAGTSKKRAGEELFEEEVEFTQLKKAKWAKK